MEVHHHHEEQNPELNSDDIEELDELEEDVKNMAQKIAEFRETLPDQLKNSLASIIAAQRPAILTGIDDDSHPGPSDNPNPDARTRLDSEHMDKILVEKDPKHTEKIQIIKQKISDNASMMPILVTRMKECMSRINKLQHFKQDVIHPAFTRKRTT
ncbi:hypothetical protein L2E82_45856 [Cichorium intybus]|uniref:Uncharacterized protein n=1 Tax=Cichorium intybus TaxID=13427 RepID=A0ACB8ZTQ0_CICIN|nr:hypothetical protein L2E82_45856 [Cichorium intybus]